MIIDLPVKPRPRAIDRTAHAPLLRVEDLHIATARGTPLVRGMNFALRPGGSLGIVGESGSGKSLTCRAILGVLQPGLEITRGTIHYDDTDLTTLDRRGWRALRGKGLGAIFQDPGSYLNPSIPVGRQLAEALRATLELSRSDAYARSLDLFRQVGLRDAEAVYRQYPFELSGGMVQRVLIAIAICATPRLLIADEATTALDATVQAEVLDLLSTLRREMNLALILVSHDLAVVSQACEQIVVLRDGVVLEAGDTADVLANPHHDFTRLLVEDHRRHGIGHAMLGGDRNVHALSKEPLPQPAATAGSARPDALLSVTRLAVAHGLGSRRKTVLHGIDLEVSPGEIVGLIGETGSGKTTLLRAILGAAPHSAGRIVFDGQDIGRLRGAALRAFRRTGKVQYVFQDPLQSLDPDLTIGRSIAEGLEIRGDRPHEIERRITAVLDEAGLDQSLRGQLPRHLSGGQRQRAVLARALVLDPALLLLDEPVSALDAANRAQILELLARLGADRGIAQIFLSHDLGSVASIAHRIAVLNHGKIVETGSSRQILTRPQHAYTRDLIRSAPTLPLARPEERRDQATAIAAVRP